jgi:CubicO group peptidase (beta-lactamase class C family)
MTHAPSVPRIFHRRSLLAAAVAALALVAPAAGAIAAVPAPNEVDEVFAEQLDVAGIPGGALVTVTAGGDVDARGVGTTGAGDEVTADTPFVVGSTTKSFTALAVMQLVEAGRIDLDAPVVRYVPELELAPEEPVDAITVRHLLQHTSGLDDLAGGPLLSSVGEGTALAAVAELSDARLASAPGVKWRYANANYVLAGLVIEAASGQTYADHLQQQVLDPLGMTDTYVVADPSVAPGHRYWFGLAVAADEPVQREGVVAAGYLASTAEDLGRYLAMYLRGGTASDGTRVLSADGIRTLTAPGPEAHLGPWAESQRARYAMGWMVGGPWAEPAVFHPGNSPDSSAMIALFPGRGLAAATLVPAGHELPLPGNPAITDRISRNTMHAVLEETVPEPTSPWGFYAWFDAVVVALVALGLWTLVRAARAYGQPAPGRRRRWLRPLPTLLTVLLLVALPALTPGGWGGVWTWAPDLGLTLLLLVALTAAAGGLRLLTAVRAAKTEHAASDAQGREPTERSTRPVVSSPTR